METRILDFSKKVDRRFQNSCVTSSGFQIEQKNLDVTTYGSGVPTTLNSRVRRQKRFSVRFVPLNKETANRYEMLTGNEFVALCTAVHSNGSYFKMLARIVVRIKTVRERLEVPMGTKSLPGNKYITFRSPTQPRHHILEGIDN